MGKISAMTAATAVVDADLVPIVSGGASKKATAKQIRARHVIYKSADESVASSDVLQDDNHLTTTVEVGTYLVTIMLFGSFPSLTGIKVALDGTSVAANFILGMAPFTAALVTAYGSPYQVLSASNYTGLVFQAAIEVSSAGTLKLQWAQAASDPTNTTVKRGSYMLLERVTG